jgi:hypothetical protein
MEPVVGRVPQAVRAARDRYDNPAYFIFRGLQPGNEFELHPPIATCCRDGQAVVFDDRGHVVAEPGEYPVEIKVPVRSDPDCGNSPSLIFGIAQHGHCPGSKPGLSPSEPQRPREDGTKDT